MKSSLTRSQWVLIITLALAAAPYFLRLGASSLWDSNEAFYAETPREMVESHDYVNPTFNYRARLNKPPLSYWVVAPFYQLLGVSEASERLPIVLGAMMMIATAYALGRLVFSIEAGLLGAIGLAAAPRFLMFSRRIMIDVYLSMFMSLALLMFVLAERRLERRRLYLGLMYASIGLGVMTKGPVAAALPAVAFVVYLAAYRELKKLREMMIPTGLIIVAVIVLPWYVAIYYQHGWTHIQTFILQDNLSRYTQAGWGPRRSFFFYIPALCGDFFPWSFFLIPLAWFGAKRLWSLRTEEHRLSSNSRGAALLAIWIVVIVAFFSFSRSKEDLYILPIYPAAAALVGGLLERFIGGHESRRQAVMNLAAIVLALSIAVAGAVILYFFDREGVPYKIAGASLIGYIAIIGGMIAVAAGIGKKRRAALLTAALSVAACNWCFVLLALPDFERFKPVRPLCEVINAEAGPDSVVGYYRTSYPSMAFYLRRPIFEYYYPDEIETVLSSDKEVFCLMTEAEYESLRERVPFQMRVLASPPIFQVKLNGILDRVELPRVVLISNKAE